MDEINHTSGEGAPRGEGAASGTMEAFAQEQLRLENAWLRQRLHAMAKLAGRGAARQRECGCELCRAGVEGQWSGSRVGSAGC